MIIRKILMGQQSLYAFVTFSYNNILMNYYHSLTISNEAWIKTGEYRQ